LGWAGIVRALPNLFATLEAYNARMVFIELPLFAKYFALSDSELRELQTRLLGGSRKWMM
jgi:hypothetical protein